jgi:hypothetical protein
MIESRQGSVAAYRETERLPAIVTPTATLVGSSAAPS